MKKKVQVLGEVFLPLQGRIIDLTAQKTGKNKKGRRRVRLYKRT